jgi:hypothetical protein
MNAREFLETYIVARAGELPEETRRAFTPDQQLEMNLTGPDGGTFTLSWVDGQSRLEEKAAETPVVRMTTKARAFLELMTGRYSEFIDITRLTVSDKQFMLDPMSMMSPKKLEMIKLMRGTLCIQYCDGSTPNDDLLSETFMAFNGEEFDFDDPRCTVLMPIGKLERIAKGEVTPPQLMISGGMRVTGDMQMVVQLSPLLR